MNHVITLKMWAHINYSMFISFFILYYYFYSYNCCVILEIILRPQKEVSYINPSTSPLSSYALISLPFPVFPSSCLVILFTGRLLVITFASGKHFRLDDTGQRGPEGNTAVGSRGAEVSNILIPTTCGTLFCGLSIVMNDE